MPRPRRFGQHRPLTGLGGTAHRHGWSPHERVSPVLVVLLQWARGIATAFLLLSPNLASAIALFDPPITTAVPSDPTAMAIADFDQDGLHDALVRGNTPTTSWMSVLKGNGDDTFA